MKDKKRKQVRLSQEETTPNLSQRSQGLCPPTKYQWSLLKKLRVREGVPKADRGVHKGKRIQFCQSAMGKARRRAYVMKAIEEIDAAKWAELWYIKDEQRWKVGGRSPYKASAPRRRRTTAARDVTVWLAWKKIGKFGLRTIQEDIRCLKK